MEVVLLEVVGDPLTEHSSLHIGGAEVDAGPHSSIDNLLERVGEPLKAPRRTGFIAKRAEANPVSAEEVLERMYERTSRAGMPRGAVWEGREEREQRVADWRRGVKQRQPCRVGLGVGIAVGVGLANRCDRPPEPVVVLVVPTADLGVSRSQILHGKHASTVDDI